MKRTHSVCSAARLCALGLFLLLVPLARAIDLNDPDVRARLDRGEEVVEVKKTPGTHTLTGQVCGVIDAPRRTVWAALSDYSHLHEFMPRMKANFMVYPEVLKRIENIEKLKDAVPIVKEFEKDSITGDTVYEYDFFDFPFPVGDRRCIVRSLIDTVNFTSHYLQMKGDMKVNDGSWDLLPWGDRTLAMYTSRADIGTIIPDFLIRIATRHVLPDVIESLRRRVSEKFPTETTDSAR